MCPNRRVRREEYMEHGYLEPDERLEILENAGHSAAVISHVEKETIRINRERWESNEYDLMYQYGLGEVPVMEMSDDENDDLLFLSPVGDSGDEADACNMMQIDHDDGDCASASNQDEAFYYSARNVLVDAEVRFTMEEIDAYDTRRYDEVRRVSLALWVDVELVSALTLFSALILIVDSRLCDGLHLGRRRRQQQLGREQRVAVRQGLV